MAPSFGHSREGATIIPPLQGAPIGRLPSAAFSVNTSLGYGTTSKNLQPDRLLCGCCSRSYTGKSSSSPDSRSRKDGSRKYFRQFVLDTASDEELEMMLQEETEQLQDLELLIQDMQNSPEEHAAGLLVKLRTGMPISQLIRRYFKGRSNILQ
jgi:hypothetical protein